MPNDPARIKYLLERYAAKSCTEEELDELFRAVKNASADETLHAFMEEQYQRFDGNEILPEVDYEQVYQNILQHTPARRRKIFTLPRVAAAAVLILLAGAAVLWQARREETVFPTTHIQQLEEDIQPGGTNAMLTLDRKSAE